MITPNYSEKLEENKKYAKYCEAHKVGPDIWQVSSGEKQYYVNLATKSCDCRRWDMTGVTCSHVIAAMSKVHMHPEDFVHEFSKNHFILKHTKTLCTLSLVLNFGLTPKPRILSPQCSKKN